MVPASRLLAQVAKSVEADLQVGLVDTTATGRWGFKMELGLLAFDAYGSSTAVGAVMAAVSWISVAGLRDRLPRKVNGV